MVRNFLDYTSLEDLLSFCGKSFNNCLKKAGLPLSKSKYLNVWMYLLKVGLIPMKWFKIKSSKKTTTSRRPPLKLMAISSSLIQHSELRQFWDTNAIVLRDCNILSCMFSSTDRPRNVLNYFKQSISYKRAVCYLTITRTF